VVSDWAAMEYIIGACEEANKRVRDFIELVQMPQISEISRSNLISALIDQEKMILSRSRQCPEPNELLALKR
jgi:hypothetical protein